MMKVGYLTIPGREQGHNSAHIHKACDSATSLALSVHSRGGNPEREAGVPNVATT